MQKNKGVTIFILVLIFIYFLFSQFYLKTLGSINTYIINPIFFIIVAIFVKFIITSPYKNNKFKKTFIKYVIIIFLAYAIVYIISGLLLTYGKNPYSTSIKGILLNLYSMGIVIVAREYIRYKLIGNTFKDDRKLIFILIIIVFSMQDIQLSSLQNSLNIYFLIKIILESVIPSIVKNTLFTYMTMHTDFLPAILYDILFNLILWIPPVLPNTPWTFNAVVDTVFPLILLLYCRYHISSKDKLNIYKIYNPIKPIALIPTTLVIILVIWFAIGIFPIKPIGIASASMAPKINIGDMIIIKKCSSNDIEINDVIEYRRGNYSVIHRVTDKYQIDGQTYFITKGDNNKDVDNEPVKEEQLRGKAIGRIPYVAMPTIWLEKLSGRQSYVEVETGN